MSTSAPTGARSTWAIYGLTALALSVGWGIRGQFGHEFGAMIAGAMAAIALVLLSGREDWWRRVAYFGMFGALGWSFGGSMSYMQVVAYTHSGHSASVLYGFACLFVLGFLWAAPGGAGTALPAVFDRDRMTELFTPMSVVFLAWWLEEALLEPWMRTQGYDLNWYDTDWLGALVAIVAVLGLAAVRRRIDRGSSLILHMAIGWWAGFSILVLALGLRMTPPRGDNWSGCVGLVGGLLVYCWRQDLGEIARATLVTGFIGGIGFAAASMLKLVEVTCGYQTNWHSILEQTTGLFNGLAIAAAMLPLIRRAPATIENLPARRWTEVYAVGFVLLAISYLNFRKNIADWLESGDVPRLMHDIPVARWFDFAYILLAIAILVPLIRHLSRPLAFLQLNPLGRGQWLFLAFLWWMVIGNFEKAVVHFTAQRLVTEGVILVNAVLCTLLALLVPTSASVSVAPEATTPQPHFRWRNTVAVGLVVSALSVVADWGVVRAVYGDKFAGHAKLHIRFGPNATTQAKPKS